MTKFFKSATVTLFIVTFLFPAVVGADKLNKSAVDFQRELIGTGHLKVSELVSVEIALSFPDLADHRPAVIYDELPVTYKHGDETIMLHSKDIPFIVSDIREVPDKFQPISVGLEILQEVIYVRWDDPEDLFISDVDMGVSVYKEKAQNVDEEVPPIVEFELKNVEFLLESIDADKNIITLSFDSSIPATGNELFDTLLKDQTLKGLVTIERFREELHY